MQELPLCLAEVGEAEFVHHGGSERPGMGSIQLLDSSVIRSAKSGDHAGTKGLEVREGPIQRSCLHVVIDAQILIRVELMIEAQGDLVITGVPDRDRLKIVICVPHVGAGRICIRAWHKLKQVECDRVKTSGRNNSSREE